MSGLGIITGTKREAACLRPLLQSSRIDVHCSGADAGRAHALAEAAATADCTGLISFGVSGGLDPSLSSGTLVIADSVMSPDGMAFPTDPSWRSAVEADLSTSGIDFVTGVGMGVDEAICHPEPKRLLYEGTGALCVDMESHAATTAARKYGLPLLVIRAIADRASDTLPEIAMAAVGTGGEIRYGVILARFLRQPGELGNLIRLWRQSRPAFAVLGRVASLPSLRGPL